MIRKPIKTKRCAVCRDCDVAYRICVMVNRKIDRPIWRPAPGWCPQSYTKLPSVTYPLPHWDIEAVADNDIKENYFVEPPLISSIDIEIDEIHF
jgi:hypothetical protein